MNRADSTRHLDNQRKFYIYCTASSVNKSSGAIKPRDVPVSLKSRPAENTTKEKLFGSADSRMDCSDTEGIHCM